MVTILAIGNSFSQDATTYLHDIAECGGLQTKVVNLYIGGCSLEQHWQNASGDFSEYDYQLNGVETGKKISIKNALIESSWDFVTLQQSSRDSGDKETYYPYITNLHEYVSKFAPNAKQLIHQTWAYETDCTHRNFANYEHDQLRMYTALQKAYAEVSADLKLDIIPTGDIIQALRKTTAFNYAEGKLSLCRDGYHLDLTYGRYAAAAVWYSYILNGDITNNSFLPSPEEQKTIDAHLINAIKETVNKECKHGINTFQGR